GPVPSLERPEGRSWFLSSVVDVLREGLPLPTGNTKFPKSRTGGTSHGRVGTLGAKPAVVASRSREDAWLSMVRVETRAEKPASPRRLKPRGLRRVPSVKPLAWVTF